MRKNIFLLIALLISITGIINAPLFVFAQKEITGTLSVSGALRECPIVNCTIIRYYAEAAQIKIVGLDDAQIWYQVKARDDFDKEVNGWMHHSLFTQDFRKKFSTTQETPTPQPSPASYTPLEAGITPDSPLYFIDIFFERISLFFSFNSEAKIQKLLRHTEERLSEIAAMAVKNKPQAVEKAAAAYEKSLEKAAAEIAKLKDDKKVVELFSAIAENTTKHQDHLTRLSSIVTEETKRVLEKAGESSKEQQERALKQLASSKQPQEAQKPEQEQKKQVADEEFRTEVQTAPITTPFPEPTPPPLTSTSPPPIPDPPPQNYEPLAPLPKTYKASEIVAQNEKYIVHVWCQTSSQPPYGSAVSRGSGIVIGRANNSIVVLTSGHVTKYAKTPPAGIPPCAVDAGENGSYYAKPIYYPNVASPEEMALVDFSFLKVTEPIPHGNEIIYDPETGQFSEGGPGLPITKLLSFNAFPEICPPDRLKIGEAIAVLGYPAIGGGEFLGIPVPRLTITEGVISSKVSSFDTYFVSSAKIEQGNSGGGAFLNTTGCLAGMPTFAKIGVVESLGRLINLANLKDKYLKFIF